MRLYIHAHKDPRLPLNKLTCIYFLREGAFHILDEAMKILHTCADTKSHTVGLRFGTVGSKNVGAAELHLISM